MDFHAVLAVPKDDKPSHPRLAQLPEIESFAKTDRERKLLTMWRSFRTATTPFVMPPGTPKDRVEILQEGMRKVFADPEFRAEFKKLANDDASPLMPEELPKSSRHALDCRVAAETVRCRSVACALAIQSSPGPLKQAMTVFEGSLS
jgi:hypothetical protein